MTYQALYRHRPAHRWTNGDLACKLGADLGLPPDDEQKWILDAIFAETDVDRPASFEVAGVGPRQNFKTSTFGIAALADLFVFGVDRHLWSSHLLDTSKGTFNDFKQWIDSNHEYADQVHYFEGHQDLAIIHTDSDRKIEFKSRTGRASRGLTGVKRITLDEALYLEPQHIGAVYPTMLTMRGAQVRVGSSAGLLKSAELRRIRDKGRVGKDPRGTYVEYGAERRGCADRHCTHTYGQVKGCALDDRELWWQSNCALWSGRIVEESVEELRSKMPPEEFMREMLSWWEDPVSSGGAFPYGAWLNLADPDAMRGQDVVFGLDIAEDRNAWVAVAWLRPDGRAQVMLANDGHPFPAIDALDECKRLQNEWGGALVPPRSLEPDLERADVRVSPLTSLEFPVACNALLDMIEAGTVHHGDQQALNDAVSAAMWRPVSVTGERAVQMKGFPQVAPVVAAIRALSQVHITIRPPLPPRRVDAAIPSRESVAAMSF